MCQKSTSATGRDGRRRAGSRTEHVSYVPTAACDDRPLRGSQIRTPELQPVEPNRRCHRAHANQKGRLEPPEPFAQGTVNLIAKAPRYDNAYRQQTQTAWC